MNDGIRAWIAPLLAEMKERQLEPSGEILAASERKDGNLYGEMNWEKFGQLLIARLGWEDQYPSKP